MSEKSIQQESIKRVLEPIQGMNTGEITAYLSMVLSAGVEILRG